MARRAIKHGIDGKGDKLALVDNDDGSFMVMAKRGNYAAHVRGGMAWTWRALAKSRTSLDYYLTREDAEALFKRRDKTPA